MTEPTCGIDQCMAPRTTGSAYCAGHTGYAMGPLSAPPAAPSNPAPAPVKKQHTGLGALIAILVIGAIVWGATSLGHKHHANTGADAGTVAVSANDGSGSLAQRVSDWYDGVKPDFAAITNDMGRIGAAGDSGSVPRLYAACESAKQDIEQFETDPAAPDAQLRQDLARAMDAWSTGATLCLGGQSQWPASASSIRQGTRWIHLATARISDLTP